jgi:ubiquinone/menaquinone biosynthesis C-methylase UbiE
MKNKELMKQVISLYQTAGWKKWFSSIRFWDAPFAQVERLVPKKGKVIDLGCGEGIFTNYLGLASSSRDILGIELNRTRVSQADRGLTNVEFRKGDVVKSKLPIADCIISFHLLHHLPSRNDQEKVLTKCHRSLTSKGKLIVVEVIEVPLLKYVISWLTDAFIVPILFENKLFDFSFNYRKKREWEMLLNKLGFKVTTKVAHQGKPFSHVVFTCVKS